MRRKDEEVYLLITRRGIPLRRTCVFGLYVAWSSGSTYFVFKSLSATSGAVCFASLLLLLCFSRRVLNAAVTRASYLVKITTTGTLRQVSGNTKMTREAIGYADLFRCHTP